MIAVDLEPDLHERLREQADGNGMSVDEFASTLVHAAYDAARAERRRDEKARWDALFALAVTLPPGTPDSTEIIRRMRDER